MINNELRILVADDDPCFAEMLGYYLGSMGYYLDIAENGSTAYQYVRTREYDLVLIDFNIPLMDRIDSIKAIREKNESVYIVLMGGDISDETEAAVRLGANAILFKPFPMALLQIHLNRVQRWKETCAVQSNTCAEAV